MSDSQGTLHVGLTGGIAAGKSAVARRLAEHGAVIIDADRLARDALAPGSEGLDEVSERFGEQVIQDDGGLDRGALGEVVFADDQARQDLNDIVHPRVRSAARLLRQAAAPGSIVVEDIPLLVETGQKDRFDEVIVVHAPQAQRIRRMVEDRGMTQEEAASRIAAQASDEVRNAAATHLLDNSGTLEELLAQVDELVVNLRSRLGPGE